MTNPTPDAPEAGELRAILGAIFHVANTQVFRADQIITLEQNAAELNRRLNVIIEMTREYRLQPPTQQPADAGTEAHDGRDT